MSDEQTDAVLLRAARAYRERHDGSSTDAGRTRARILATRERDRQRTMVAIAAAALLAIGLGVPTAWAWSTGRLADWLDGSAPDTSEPGRECAPEQTSMVRDEPASTPAPLAPTGLEPTGPQPTGPQPTGPEQASSAAPPGPTSVASGGAPTEPELDERDPVDPTERRAYREAHALHFDAHDPAGALAAWDRYLGAYPRGRFAIEARYNRALCLVRLDRRDEARAALAPFAEGRHGEYRQREAVALIEALSE